MPKRALLSGAVAVIGASACLVLLGSGAATVRAQVTPQPDVGALKAEIDALRALVPSQSHAMADVDYHFSNLWFAAENENWPLAGFYLNETRSHLNWAVRIRPVRRLSSGGPLELRPMLQGIENSGLASVKAALEKRDRSAFEQAYRQTMNECFACHQAAEKPYLRPHVPESAASRMIEFRPAGPAR
jgi:hypothetical protein